MAPMTNWTLSWFTSLLAAVLAPSAEPLLSSLDELDLVGVVADLHAALLVHDVGVDLPAAHEREGRDGERAGETHDRADLEGLHFSARRSRGVARRAVVSVRALRWSRCRPPWWWFPRPRRRRRRRTISAARTAKTTVVSRVLLPRIMFPPDSMLSSTSCLAGTPVALLSVTSLRAMRLCAFSWSEDVDPLAVDDLSVHDGHHVVDGR